MSERGCMKCGYILTGLPAEGTVVSCPECGQRTDLSVPPSPPIVWAKPALWGMIPAGGGAIAAFLIDKLAPSNSPLPAWLLIAGLHVGSISAGVLMYREILREPARGLPMRPPWVRVGATFWAAICSFALYAVILLLFLFVRTR